MSRGRKSSHPEKGRLQVGGSSPAPDVAGPQRLFPHRRLAALLGGAALIAVLLAAALLSRSLLWGASEPKTAAIVDQLALTQPNPAFVASATDTLTRAGYAVDYFPGEEVTVEFYRRLATRGYDYVILRNHSARRKQDEQVLTEEVDLFTADPYSETQYGEDRKNRRLSAAFYHEGGLEYFAVTPAFVQESMQGRFGGALVIMMGCDGVRSRRMADAFLHKGASAFVSWDKPVSATHTDAATQRLLEKLLFDDLTVADAVSRTAAELGPDPAFGAQLRMLTDGG